jgi:hypothetical protein
MTQLLAPRPATDELLPAAAPGAASGTAWPVVADQPYVVACRARPAAAGSSAVPELPAPPRVSLWTGPPDAAPSGAGVVSGCGGAQGTCTEQGQRPMHSAGCCSGGERRLHRSKQAAIEVSFQLCNHNVRCRCAGKAVEFEMVVIYHFDSVANKLCTCSLMFACKLHELATHRHAAAHP